MGLARQRLTDGNPAELQAVFALHGMREALVQGLLSRHQIIKPTNDSMRLSFVSRSLPQAIYVLLCLAFLITFVVTLWMAFYTPVYPDEIFWKVMIARLDSDGGKLVYLFAQCRQGQWIDAPLTWYPAMWINAWLYEDASRPWELRVHGWILFLVLLGLWTWLLREKSGIGWPDSFLAVSAFLSMGTMPFLMVLGRPEQPLLLLLTLALLTTLIKPPETRVSWGRGLIYVLGFALIGTLMAGIHPKGMFLFPVLMVLAWRQVRSLSLMALLALVLGRTAFDTHQVWQLRTSCPEIPGLMKVLQSLTLRPSMFFSDPIGFIKAGVVNLMAFGAYVTSLEFRESYISSWMPSAVDWSATAPLVLIANSLIWLPVLMAALIIGANGLAARHSRNWTDVLIWLGLLLPLGTIAGLQMAKNFYEASIIWPLILLLVIFSFGKPLIQPARLGVRIVLVVLMGVALVSGIIRFDRFGDAMQEWRKARAEQTEYVDRHNQALREFARQQCAIGDDAKRLVLDNNAYQAFWANEQPIFLDYVAGWWGAESDIKIMLQDRQVGGLISKCDRIPEVLRPFMVRETDEAGGNCCIAAQHLR